MAISIGVIEGTIRLRDEFTSRLDASAAQLEKHGERMRVVGQRMSSVGSLLTAGVTLPMVAAGSAAIKMAMDLNEGMANVATLIPGNTERVADLRTEIQGLAVDVGKTTSDLAAGLYQTISAFGDTAETVEVLEINARAATAGLSTTLEAIDLTSAVTKGYGDTSAEAVQKVADLALMAVRLGQTTFPELAASMGRVIPLAEAVGQSQEDMFAVFATATGVVGGAAEVATQYRGIINALLKPTADLSALITQQGFASGEAMLRQLGLVDTLELIATTATNTGKPITDYIAQIEAVPLALALAGPQADVFREKLRQMSEAAGATDAAFREQTEGVNAAGFAWKQTRREIEVALQNLGQELLPTFTAFLKVLRPVIGALEGVAKGLGSLPEPARAVAVAFLGIAAAAGPALFVSGQLIMAWGTLASTAPLLAARIALVGNALRTVATGPLGILAAAFVATGVVINEQLKKWAAASERDINAMVQDIDKLRGALDGLRAAARRGVITDDEILAARRALQPLTKELAEIERKLKFSSDRSEREGLLFRKSAIQSEMASMEAMLRVAAGIPRINEEITVTAEEAAGPPGGITQLSDALGDALKSIAATTAEQEALLDALADSGEAYENLNTLLDHGVPLADALTGAYDNQVRAMLTLQEQLREMLALREREKELLEQIRQARLDNQFESDFPIPETIQPPNMEPVLVEWKATIEEMDQAWSEGIGKMSTEMEAIQRQAWANIQDIAADAIAEIIKTGKVDFDSLFDSVLDIVAQMLAKMLVLWLANLAKRVAAEQAGATRSAAAWEEVGSGSGGGGNIFGSLARLFGFGGGSAGFSSGVGAAGNAAFGGGTSTMTNAYWAQYTNATASGISQGIGGASWGTLGVMFGTAAAAVIIADFAQGWSERQDQKRTAGTIRFGPQEMAAFSGDSGLNQAMVDSLEALQQMFRDLEILTGASLDILDQVEINVKGNNRIWVNIGTWFTREVESMEEALDLVVTQLVQRSNVIGGSPAIRAALENFTGSTIDELNASIAAALRSEELFLGQEGATAIRQRTSEFFELLQQEIELGLIEAQGGSGALTGLVRSYQENHDRLLGIQRDVAEQARMEARAHNAALAMDRARLEMMRAEILATGAAVQAGGGFVNGMVANARAMHAGTIATGGMAQATAAGANVAATAARIQAGLGEVMAAGGQAAAANAEAQGALAQTQIAGAQVAVTAAQAHAAALEAINEALALLEGLDVDIEAAAAAARRAGGGTRRSDMEAVRDLIDQMRFDRLLLGMTDLEAGLARLEREYQSNLERAHGNAELVAQLTEEYRLQEEQLRRNIQLSAVDTFQGFMGIGADPFSQLQEGFEEASDAIRDAGFGASRTARMLRRLNRSYEEQLEILSQQEFVYLGDSLMGILERYYGGVEGFEEVRMVIERTRFELELMLARQRFEILKAEGTLAAAVLAQMQQVFDFIDSNPIDWGQFVAPSAPALADANRAAQEVNDTFAEMARRLASAKDSITDFLLSLQRGAFGGRSNEQMFNAAMKQFDRIRQQALAGNIQAIEGFPEAARNFLEISRERFGSTAEFQRILSMVEGSGIDLLGIDRVREDNIVFDQRFFDAQAHQIEATTQGHQNVANAIRESDRARAADEERSREDIVQALRDLRIAQEALNNRLAAIEARKRTEKAA